MTPDDELARRVAAVLMLAGVVPSSDVGAFAGRLARGEVRAAEWTRLVEDAGPIRVPEASRDG